MSSALTHQTPAIVSGKLPASETARMIRMMVDTEEKVISLHEAVADSASVDSVKGLLADVIAARRQQISELERAARLLKGTQAGRHRDPPAAVLRAERSG
jgi:hypothetical protein